MQRTHRRCHRLIWIVLGPLILVVILVAVFTRPTWPVDEPVISVQESTP